MRGKNSRSDDRSRLPEGLTGTPTEDSSRPLQWRLIIRIFDLLRPHSRKRNWLLLCVIALAVQQPAFAWGLAAVIDGPIANSSGSSAILTATGLLFGLCLLMQGTLYFRQRLTLELGEAVVTDLRRAVFDHLQQMPMGYFHRTKVGRVLSRISGDCNAVRIGVQDVLFVSLIGLGQMLIAACLMAYYSMTLFAVVLAMTPFFAIANQVFRKRLGQAYRDVQENFSRFTGWIAEHISGMPITQAFDRGRLNAALFRDMVMRHARYNMAAAKISGAFLPLIELNSQLFLAALIAVGGHLVLVPAGSTTLGDVIQFLFLAGIFFNPIQVLASQYNQALTAMAGAERVFDLLDMPAEESVSGEKEQNVHLSGNVRFCGVTFGYDPQQPILHELSFTAECGQTVALVGESGSGKTTITNLLVRYYIADRGQILLDGTDIRHLSRESLHRQISIVPQVNYLFSGTIADNLRLASPESSEAELWQAFRNIGCEDILAKLPDGLDTLVGPRGSRISVGQRQLICLARAILMQPKILILDEATSSIDSISERKIQTAIQLAQRDRTTFIVAHRLSTIMAADTILVMDQGRIVQRGSHEELKDANGIYANLLMRYNAA